MSAIRDENIVCKPEIEIKTELNVTLPEPTKNISMNSLLSPLNQVHHDTKDNNTLNRTANGMNFRCFFFILFWQLLFFKSFVPILVDNCQEAVTHSNVKNQSTSPNIPNDLDVLPLKSSEQPTTVNV